jgi:hypothetical protein
LFTTAHHCTAHTYVGGTQEGLKNETQALLARSTVLKKYQDVEVSGVLKRKVFEELRREIE